jgi:hypothetical protein
VDDGSNTKGGGEGTRAMMYMRGGVYFSLWHDEQSSAIFTHLHSQSD